MSPRSRASANTLRGRRSTPWAEMHAHGNSIRVGHPRRRPSANVAWHLWPVAPAYAVSMTSTRGDLDWFIGKASGDWGGDDAAFAWFDGLPTEPLDAGWVDHPKCVEFAIKLR